MLENCKSGHDLDSFTINIWRIFEPYCLSLSFHIGQYPANVLYAWVPVLHHSRQMLFYFQVFDGINGLTCTLPGKTGRVCQGKSRVVPLNGLTSDYHLRMGKGWFHGDKRTSLCVVNYMVFKLDSYFVCHSLPYNPISRPWSSVSPLGSNHQNLSTLHARPAFTSPRLYSNSPRSPGYALHDGRAGL